MVLEITANLNGGDLVTPDNELTYKIYGSADNYASPIANLGSAVNDAKVSVLNGVVTIINVDVGNETSFKISSIDAAGNEAVLSDTSDTPFIIEIDSTESGVSNTDQFQFTGAEGDYDVVAKQNNIVVATFNDLSGEQTITLPSSGIYVLEVSAKEVNGFNRIQFDNGGDKLKITDIKQWGDVVWSSFERAFYGCSNMLTTATDVPNLSSVTDMYAMFLNASSANPNTTNWDVSSVTNMGGMFYNTSIANPDTSNWDVSSVTNMRSMFYGASSANPDTSNWDVSSVTNMRSMFYGATSANPDTSNWDLSSVTDMYAMFYSASSANPDTSNWDVSSVTNMTFMFYNTSIANPDVSNWDVSSVTTMYRMFEDSNLSVENLTSIYENWSQLNLQQNVEFGAGTTEYNTFGQEGRDILVNTYNWTITDGGLVSPFIIEVDTSKAGSASDAFEFTGAVGDYDVIAKQNGTQVATFNDLSNQETITLPSSGIYVLEVKSKEVNGFNRIQFNNGGDKLKITDIKQWGDVVWSSFSESFFGCSNMLTTATDIPNLSNVTNMSNMFRNTSSANPDTINWDVSSVTNMGAMFRDATSANPDTSNWDVSNVTTMRLMFLDSNLSQENLTACYENWSQLTLQNNVSFSAGNTKYNASGQAGRDILVNTYNWTITDGGQV